MPNLRGKKIVAPLSVAALVLALTGCVNQTPADDGSMSAEVQANIKSTVTELSTLMVDDKFMDQVFSAGTGQEAGFKGVDEQVAKVDNLVADDESLNVMKEHAQNTLGTPVDLNDEQAEEVAKTAPLALFGYTFGKNDQPAAEVFLDTSGFEKRDGTWVMTKHGALALKDKLGRYTSLVTIENRLSFTEDGKKVTLSSLKDSVELEKSPLYNEVYKASEAAWSWLGEHEAEDFGTAVNKNADTILKDIQLRDGTTMKFGPTEEGGFTVTGTHNGESLVYSSDTGLIRTDKEANAPRTDAKVLFDEFDKVYMGTLWAEGGPNITETTESLKNNGIMDEATWTVKKEGDEEYPVATLNGQEYAFVVPDYAIPADDDISSEETPLDPPASPEPTATPTATAAPSPTSSPSPAGRDLDANPEEAVDDPTQIPSSEASPSVSPSKKPETKPADPFPTDLPTRPNQPGD